MSLVLEVLTLMVSVMWLWLVAIFKALVPAKYQGLKDVRGQLVLITGAGSGLGRLMSQRFAALGCRLVLWDIDEKGNAETAGLVRDIGAQVTTYTVDLSLREKIYETADKVKAEVGNVDILVNNAGIVTGRTFLDCPDKLIEKTMMVNTNAHFWTVKAFLPAMMEKNHGHIVSIASSAGLFGVSGLADYCASKFGAVGFDESLRNELVKLGKTGVHTTVVCPYFINTGMFAGTQSKMMPMLSPEDVVTRIVEAVLTNQQMLIVPKMLYVMYFMRGLLPLSVGNAISLFMGVSSSMDTFVGRSKTN